MAALGYPNQLTASDRALKPAGILSPQNPILLPPDRQGGTGNLRNLGGQEVIAAAFGKSNQRLLPAGAGQVQGGTEFRIGGDEGLVTVGLAANAAPHPRVTQKSRGPAIERRHHQVAHGRASRKAGPVDQHESGHGIGVGEGKIQGGGPPHRSSHQHHRTVDHLPPKTVQVQLNGPGGEIGAEDAIAKPKPQQIHRPGRGVGLEQGQ